jgi:putative ABC transport system permease protein
MRELRDAVRQWARTPAITVVVVLSLALGIGANTAIFSLIDSLLLRPLPVRTPERLVRIQEANFTHGIPVWRQIQDGPPILDGTAAMTLLRPDISSTPERRSAFGLGVTGTFFDLLGVRPAIGRLLTVEDDQPGSPAVAVTDYQFWQAAFGGRPDILGATIRLEGKPFTIVGVTERGFFGLNFGRRFDVAIGLNGYRTLYPDSLDSIRNSFSIIGRLRAGQAHAEAEAALRALQAQIRATLQIPDNQPLLKQPWHLQPIASGIIPTTQERYAQPLLVLMALVALVLLIACTNVANLLLARGSARRGELAVRRSLGASRWQLLRSAMMENLLIALAGAAAALFAGIWTARAIVNAVAVNESGAIATWLDVPLNYRIFGFTIAVGTATAILFGIGPAILATRVDPLDAMRQRARGTVGGLPGIAHALVAFQVALAFMLVLGGGLLVRSFIAMTTQDLGFSARQVVVAVPDFSRGIVARNQRVAVADRLREQISSVPGVEATGLVESSPFGLGYAVVPIAVDGGDALAESHGAAESHRRRFFRHYRHADEAGTRLRTDWPRDSAIGNRQRGVRESSFSQRQPDWPVDPYGPTGTAGRRGGRGRRRRAIHVVARSGTADVVRLIPSERRTVDRDQHPQPLTRVRGQGTCPVGGRRHRARRRRRVPLAASRDGLLCGA